jgi:hypothetical protein
LKNTGFPCLKTLLVKAKENVNTGYEFKTAHRRRIRRLLVDEETDEPTGDAEERFRIYNFLR